MRLLVTRPEPDASAFAEELRTLGHDAILQPLLEFRILGFDRSLLKAAHAVIMTSGNAVRAIEASVARSDLADIPFYCVGEETAKRAHAAGFRALIATADTAERLAPRILSTARDGQIIVHLAGEHQAFDLAGALAAEGLPLQTLPVYSMEACRDLSLSVVTAMKAGEIDGAILMSPRTAGIYVSLCHSHGLHDSAKRLRYFCISENVAAKLALLMPDDVRVPDKPSRKALLELLHAD